MRPRVSVERSGLQPEGMYGSDIGERVRRRVRQDATRLQVEVSFGRKLSGRHESGSHSYLVLSSSYTHFGICEFIVNCICIPDPFSFNASSHILVFWYLYCSYIDSSACCWMIGSIFRNVNELALNSG